MCPVSVFWGLLVGSSDILNTEYEGKIILNMKVGHYLL